VDSLAFFAVVINSLGLVVVAVLGYKMNKKGPTNVQNGRKAPPANADEEDLFAGEFVGEFADLPTTIENPIGVVARLVCSNGGYFGLSITDDGGSARLAIRTGKFVADRRFYRLTELEAALAKAFSKLRETPQDTK